MTDRAEMQPAPMKETWGAVSLNTGELWTIGSQDYCQNMREYASDKNSRIIRLIEADGREVAAKDAEIARLNGLFTGAIQSLDTANDEIERFRAELATCRADTIEECAVVVERTCCVSSHTESGMNAACEQRGLDMQAIRALTKKEPQA